jgi:Alpha amylase, catalytic domain/Maltogenic Amylase, C-terminal domain
MRYIQRRYAAQTYAARTTVLMFATVLSCISGAAEERARTKTQALLPWYVTTPAIHRVMLKSTTAFWRFEQLSMDPATADQQMRAWKEQGITALEIFAPEEGGNSYDGLDAKDRYRLDPGLGSITDFRKLVQHAHALGMHVITFQNFGYSSVEAPEFEKAEDDVRRGQVTRESKLYFWSDHGDAPPPAVGNSYFLVRPQHPGYDAKNEIWQWSERAQHYYWTRWPGKDVKGDTIHLPQYNWVDDAWPEETAKVIRFWMSTGIDGVIADAVNWYAGYDWKKGDQSITGVIASYGETFSQPEGGGAFHTDDPVGWVTDGHWTNLFDYGLGIWWEKKNQPLRASIESSNPILLEEALQRYHDRVVAAGGTLYFPIPKFDNENDQRFAEALVASSGDMLCYCDAHGGVTRPADGIPTLLKLKAAHAALFQNSMRRRVPTNSDAQTYAVVRDAADRSERLLAVFNFSTQPSEVDVDTGAVSGSHFASLLSGTTAEMSRNKLHLRLEGHGYELFQVTP